jgi:hypothetical protein
MAEKKPTATEKKSPKIKLRSETRMAAWVGFYLSQLYAMLLMIIISTSAALWVHTLV